MHIEFEVLIRDRAAMISTRGSDTPFIDFEMIDRNHHLWDILSAYELTQQIYIASHLVTIASRSVGVVGDCHTTGVHISTVHDTP